MPPGKVKWLVAAAVVAVLGIAGFFVMSGKKKPAAPDVVFPKVMQREITGAGKLDAPPASALPASDKAAAMIDTAVFMGGKISALAS
jgi:hypothetical protein